MTAADWVPFATIRNALWIGEVARKLLGAGASIEPCVDSATFMPLRSRGDLYLPLFTSSVRTIKGPKP